MPDTFSKNCGQKFAKGKFSESFDETNIYFIICNSTRLSVLLRCGRRSYSFEAYWKYNFAPNEHRTSQEICLFSHFILGFSTESGIGKEGNCSGLKFLKNPPIDYYTRKSPTKAQANHQ